MAPWAIQPDQRNVPIDVSVGSADTAPVVAKTGAAGNDVSRISSCSSTWGDPGRM